MAKQSRREKALFAKRQRKAEMATKDHKRHKSAYARKAAYLRRFGGWGWEYMIPKPWAVAKAS